MTAREFAALASKLLACWMFVRAAIQVSNPLFFVGMVIAEGLFAGDADWRPLLSVVITMFEPVGTMVVGIVLWKWAPQIAGRLVKEDSAITASITREGVASIAMTAIGLFWIVPVLRDFSTIFYEWHKFPEAFEDPATRAASQSNFCSALVGFAICSWMIVGSRGIARAFGGTGDSEAPEVDGTGQ